MIRICSGFRQRASFSCIVRTGSPGEGYSASFGSVNSILPTRLVMYIPKERLLSIFPHLFILSSFQRERGSVQMLRNRDISFFHFDCRRRRIVTNEDIEDSVLQKIVSNIDASITQQTEKQESRYVNDKQRQYHQLFKTSTYEQFKNINPDRAPNTCMWRLSHPQYINWSVSLKDNLLWISADPGCGKSVLSKSLIDHEFHDTDTYTVCYFFFKDNEEQDSLPTALCALLHHLFAGRPELLRHALLAWARNGEKLQQEVGELWRILLAAATDPIAGNVICVLDALDECRPQDRRILIQNLSSFYTLSSSVRPNSTLKFIVTSRPYHDIELDFKDIPPSLPAIRLSGEMENDKIMMLIQHCPSSRHLGR